MSFDKDKKNDTDSKSKSCCIKKYKLFPILSIAIILIIIAVLAIYIKDEIKFQNTLKAAQKGDAFAQYVLANMYLNGKRIKQDNQKAAEWFQKAAEQGYAPAQNNLALMYIDTEGLKYDYINLACFHFKGKCVPWDNRDNQKAFEWFQKAAEQGLPEAQDNLAQMYINGAGAEQDFQKAFEWFTKAALQGFLLAKYHLARMYYNGIGIKEDKPMALAWIAKASYEGFPIRSATELRIDKAILKN